MHSYCEHCGQQIKNILLFCPYCNNRLNEKIINKHLVSFKGIDLPKYEVDILTDLEFILERDFKFVSDKK